MAAITICSDFGAKKWISELETSFFEIKFILKNKPQIERLLLRLLHLQLILRHKPLPHWKLFQQLWIQACQELLNKDKGIVDQEASILCLLLLLAVCRSPHLATSGFGSRFLFHRYRFNFLFPIQCAHTCGFTQEVNKYLHIQVSR